MMKRFFILEKNIKNASIKWTQNGNKAKIDRNKIIFKNQTGFFSGIYECEGVDNEQKTNLFYSIVKEGDLVKGKVKTFMYSPKNNRPKIRFDFLTNIHNISLNDSVKINCTSNNAVKIEWKIGNKIIKSSFLFIENFSYKNLKFYECKTSNRYGNTSIGIRFNKKTNDTYEGVIENPKENSKNRLKKSSEKNFIEKKMPSLTIALESPRKNFIKIGDKIELKCSVNNHFKKTRVNWFKETDHNHQDLKTKQVSETEKVLIIDSFEPNFIGIYTCKAEIEDSIYYNHKNWLKIFIGNSVHENLYEIRAIDSKLTPSLVFKLNQKHTNLKIECRNNERNSTVVWSKIEGSSSEWYSNRNIIKLKPEINTDYECASENELGTTRVKFKVDKINSENNFEAYFNQFTSILKKEKALDGIIKRDINRTFIVAKLGSSVILECPVKKFDDSVFWFKSSRRIIEHEKIDSKDLYINSTSQKDTGFYECITDNYKEAHALNLVISEKLPILTEKSLLAYNVSKFFKKKNFSITLSFKTSKENGTLFTILSKENDENMILSIKNGYIFFESRQKDAFEVLIKIPHQIQYKRMNTIKVFLNSSEISFVLNRQKYKSFLNYQINKKNSLMYIGSKGLIDKWDNFNGIFTSLKINERKLDLVNSALVIKNIKLKEECSNLNCRKDEVCVVSQNEKGFKCYCSKSKCDR
ncbi:unnamed protein product [Brachionus calyciflorus]|uniref:Uncharacterized protein n=1 Tax=Brachionus calyciflorus TaxID=104777 RepID=A0A813U243_9BILA|nr:unnamed protein product [Brachionus calyciflorus]